MSAGLLLYRVASWTARLGSSVQILLYLPLTLSTLGQPAFLLLSLLLTIQSLIHCTLNLFPFLKTSLDFLQLPVHPFLLLVSFNLATGSTGDGWVDFFSHAWGTGLRWSSPVFVGLEGLASILVIQIWGHKARNLAERGDGIQFGLLVASAVAYVGAATWVVLSFPATASSPVSATLLGASITCMLFLTIIGFSTRRTNVIESAGVAVYLSYNFWLCGAGEGAEGPGGGWGWKEGNLKWSEGYPPLLTHLLPYLNTLLTLVTGTIPKTLLLSLFYRLFVLHRASRVLVAITTDPWEVDDDDARAWPFAQLLLRYRQTIFVVVYSHLLLLDHTSQVWWRWTNIFITLCMWGLELQLTGDDDEVIGKEWKVD